MRVPAASVYRSGVGGVVGCVTAPTTPATHPHIDHDEEQISRLAHHLSQISGDHDGLQVGNFCESVISSPPSLTFS